MRARRSFVRRIAEEVGAGAEGRGVDPGENEGVPVGVLAWIIWEALMPDSTINRWNAFSGRRRVHERELHTSCVAIEYDSYFTVAASGDGGGYDLRDGARIHERLRPAFYLRVPRRDARSAPDSSAVSAVTSRNGRYGIACGLAGAQK